MKKLSNSLLAALTAVLVAACESTPEPVATTTAPTTPKPAVVAKTEASVLPVTTPYVYAYNPIGKRDPFRSPEIAVAERRLQGQQITCPEPLCQYDIDQLELVAVVTGDANPIAMVEDPLGRGHIVRRNSRVGKQGGKVSQILRDSITVTESFVGTDGKQITNAVPIKVKPDAAPTEVMDLLTGRSVQ